MTTLILENNIELNKTNFVDILDLYDYIVENQIVTECWELSKDQVSSDMLDELNKAKNISRSDFVNI